MIKVSGIHQVASLCRRAIRMGLAAGHAEPVLADRRWRRTARVIQAFGGEADTGLRIALARLGRTARIIGAGRVAGAFPGEAVRVQSARTVLVFHTGRSADSRFGE
jgi:hypothetical protein